MKRSPLRLAVDSILESQPDIPTLTLAKQLAKKYNTTVESARKLVNNARGTAGEYLRPYASHPRPKTAPQLPASMAQPWEKFEVGSNIKVAVLSDLHIPYHDPKVIEAAVKYCKSRNPDVVLLNGDIADFWSISRFQKDPSKRDVLSEIKAVQEALAWIRYKFKKARIIYKLGNHDERWQFFLWNSVPELCNSPRMDVSEWLETSKFGIEVVGDKRPIMLGNLPVLHGHELPKGISSPVNAARGAFMRTMSTVLVGHSHTTSQHVESNMWHKSVSCWATGCLLDLDGAEYARIHKWNNGFAFVTVSDDGEFKVENLRIGQDLEIW